MPYLGIDEQPFRKGQRTISSLVDLQQGRVLDGVEDRTEAACKALIEQSLTTEQQVTGVALDMWKAYRNSVEEKLPQADIAHDRFHISQHLNEAVDKARRQENKALKEAGDRRLAGARYSWLVNEENLNEIFAEPFRELKQADRKGSRAWAIKALFRDFWDHRYAV